MRSSNRRAFQAERVVVHIPIGGVAKRLRPLTEEISKPCILFMNRTLLEIPMVDLAKEGVKRFVFGVKGYVNYKCLYESFGNGKKFSGKYDLPRIHINYQPRLPEDVGSADSLRINMEYYNYLFDVLTPMIVFQGDNIFDVRTNFSEIISYHLEKDAFMTIGLAYVDEFQDYGIAKLDKDGKIQEFREKPRREDAPSNFANTGLYIINQKIKDVFKQERVRQMIQEKRLDFGMDMIPYLIENGYDVYGYPLKGPWYDVGSIKRYLHATQDILSGKMILDLGEQIQEGKRIFIAGISRKSKEAREAIVKKYTSSLIKFDAPILLGKHCKIGNNVRISNSCIGNYVEIKDNCSIENSVIMDNVIIDDFTEVSDSIIGTYCLINSNSKEPTRISSFSAIGDDAMVDAGSEIIASKIRPHSKILKGRYVNEDPYK
ncbi:MAG: NDP-sugar synthase [archaeon]|nr:NDP-sugar synthase [archaeon]MCP8314079.1 NDP-sugar synthase [archaeon]